MTTITVTSTINGLVRCVTYTETQLLNMLADQLLDGAA